MATAKELAAEKAKEREKTKQKALELANSTGVHVDEDILEEMEVGVFIGWQGQFPGERVFMPGVHNCWIPVDTEGKIISPLDEAGNYVDPATNENFAGRRVHEMEVGGVVFFPNKVTNPVAFGNAVRSQQFAQLKYLTTIRALYTDGFTGAEIKNTIEQVGGLITDPDVDATPRSDISIGDEKIAKKSSSTTAKKTTTKSGG